MRLPILLRRTSLKLLENAIEGLLIVETALDRYAGDVHIRIDEKSIRVTDSQRINIGNKIAVQHIRKHSGERIFSDTEMVGNRGERNIFQIMLGNIGDDRTGKVIWLRLNVLQMKLRAKAAQYQGTK